MIFISCTQTEAVLSIAESIGGEARRWTERNLHDLKPRLEGCWRTDIKVILSRSEESTSVSISPSQIIYLYLFIHSLLQLLLLYAIIVMCK